MIFYKIIHVLAEQIQSLLCEYLFIIFGVDDKLKEKHEEKIEWFESTP